MQLQEGDHQVSLLLRQPETRGPFRLHGLITGAYLGL